MRTQFFARTTAGLCFAALLAGCQMNAPQAVAPSPLQFQITDLGNPSSPLPIIAPSGTEYELPPVFDVEIRLVGVDPTGVQDLRTFTTSYTPDCNNRPVPELYRTKVIVYPYGVTAAAPTPTSIGYMLPLSSRTLMELGLCVPRMPLSGSVHLQARVLDRNNVWSTSDLTLRIVPPAAPVPLGG